MMDMFHAVIVLSLCLCSFSLAYSECPECCDCTQDKSEIRLQCRCLPSVVPEQTTYVALHEAAESQGMLSFIHYSWGNVKTLIIQPIGNPHGTFVTNGTFVGVPALETLRLSNFWNMNTIPAGTFKPLRDLKVLDLSNNRDLLLSGLTSVFPDFQNTKLELLNLSRTNKHNMGGVTGEVLDKNYLTKFPKLTLKVLDISRAGTFIVDFSRITDFYEEFRFPSLEVLNVSFSVPAANLGFGSDNGPITLDIIHIVFPNMKQIYFKGHNFPSEKHNDCVANWTNSSYEAHLRTCLRENKYIFLPSFLEIINLDNSTVFEDSCMEVLFEKAQCIKGNKTMNVLSVKHAGITGWNLMLFISVNTLDLRFNKISVVTDMSLRSISNLKRLLLGSNQLWKYETNSSFEGFLKNCPELEEVDLSANNLSLIPRFMFIRNTRLQLIDLSVNKLRTVSFEMSHLLELKILNLSRNLISTIEGYSLFDIKSLALIKNYSFIDMSGIEFTCSCDSKLFIRSLQDISEHVINVNSYQCTFDGREESLLSVDEDILNRQCILRILTVTLPVSCACLSVLVLLILLYRYRIHLIKCYVVCRFWRYRKRLAEVEDHVFLAYSHHDKELVFARIYPKLESKLQQLLHTNDDVLYVNDKHFALPGLIDEEIVTAVSSCKCLVALISRPFLKSAWTHLEVAYSWLLKRPIILVFLEDIKEDELYGLLRYLYYKNVRLMLPNVDSDEEEIFWASLLRGLVKILDTKRLEVNKPLGDIDGDNPNDDTNEETDTFL